MQALATFTSQRDIFVAEDVIDQIVHRWLFKLASGARRATESGRPLDFLLQKVSNICP